MNYLGVWDLYSERAAQKEKEQQNLIPVSQQREVRKLLVAQVQLWHMKDTEPFLQFFLKDINLITSFAKINISVLTPLLHLYILKQYPVGD